MSVVGLMKVRIQNLRNVLTFEKILQTPNINDKKTFGTAVLVDGSETKYQGNLPHPKT